MVDVFERINEVLGDVELFCVNGLWTVRVVEAGAVLLSAFPSEAEAVDYAEVEVKRLGLTSFIRL